MESKAMVARELIEQILSKRLSDKKEINKLKIKLASKYKIARPPSDTELLIYAKESEIHDLKALLVTKPIRTLSGVSVVAVMTAPFRCPHGKCIFCPGGPGSVFGDTPQSYTGNEPASRRAKRNDYDPYLQVFNRLEHYILEGYYPDKAEVIIMGGTFPALPRTYQDSFVRDIFQAFNDFSELFFKDNEFDYSKFKEIFALPSENIFDQSRLRKVKENILKIKLRKQRSLKEEQLRNEKARIRVVGLTIETKPDWGLKEHGNVMLEQGATRVELGVQTLNNEALIFNHRGHDLNDTIKSIRDLKDLGFKINAHMMLGLPKTSPEDDLQSLINLFKNPDFRPDMIKIYPTLVIQGTGLWHLWKRGQYKPLDIEKAVEIIAEFKKHVPRWVRIMRVQRDIPSTIIDAGPNKTNLRQMVEEKLHELGIECKCIRHREVGHVFLKKGLLPKNIDYRITEYEASKGREFFIEALDPEQDILIGFLRLRFPSQILRKEITETSAIVRELHVYGSQINIGVKSKEGFQHKGVGKKLLSIAEQTALKHGKNKVLVISGVGVREYYAKQGYVKEGPYMVKYLD